MWKYAAQRLMLMILILVGVSMVTFALSRVLPGSPIEMMLGHRPTQEQIDLARADTAWISPFRFNFFTMCPEWFRATLG